MLNRTFWQDVKIWYSRLIRSKTINTAHVVVILGAIQANSGFFSRWLSTEDFGTFIAGVGIVMYILRARTDRSLEDK